MKHQISNRKFSALAICAALIFTPIIASACSAPVPKINNSSDTEAIQYPNLSTDQMHAIIDSTISNWGDALADSNILDLRNSGPALELRTTQMMIDKKLERESDETIIPSSLEGLIVSRQTNFPRAFSALTSTTEQQGPNKLLIFIQDSAFANYKLWGITRLFSGLQFPTFEREALGSALVSNSTMDAKIPLTQAFIEYADLLQNGASSSFAASFAPDPLQEQIAQLRAAADAAITANGGSQNQIFEFRDDIVFGFKSVAGGALVFGRIDSLWERTAGDNSVAIAANDEEQILIGTQQTKKTITVTYEHIIAMYVPPHGSSDPIQVFGAERMPISVKIG